MRNEARIWQSSFRKKIIEGVTVVSRAQISKIPYHSRSLASFFSSCAFDCESITTVQRDHCLALDHLFFGAIEFALGSIFDLTAIGAQKAREYKDAVI